MGGPVLKPNGRFVCLARRNIIVKEICKLAFCFQWLPILRSKQKASTQSVLTDLRGKVQASPGGGEDQRRLEGHAALLAVFREGHAQKPSFKSREGRIHGDEPPNHR